MGRRAGVLAAVLALGVAVLAAPGRVAAEAGDVPLRAAEKLVRGVINLGTGWVEIVKQPYVVGAREGWLAGALRGPIEGLGMVVARTLGGAYEVLTFPLPIPPGYPPMVEPAFVWQGEAGETPTRSVPGETGEENRPQEGGAAGS